MNPATVVVLLIVAVLFALAVRSMWKSSRVDTCAGCSGDGCSVGRGAGEGPCPAALRALADVEAQLGPAQGVDADGEALGR